MVYDEGLAQRLREGLRSHDSVAPESVVEKKMFGGLGFMVQGNMCCGVSGEELMLRVGRAAYEEALARPHARPMDFTGKPMRGFVYVDEAGFESDEDLTGWLDLSVRFTLSLPAK
ncbi:MAG: TfoX/Sxy family protein [bacterium]|nr:TfoX/Sxy family protein [bacterium]